MNDEPQLPALRPLDVVPIGDDDGQVRFALQDTSGIAPQALLLSLPGYYIAAHLDGAHTLDQLRAGFAQQFGQELPVEQVFRLIDALDKALLLDNDRFRAAHAAHVAAYRAAPVRDNRQRWPDGDALRAEITAMLADGAAAPDADVAGLIAPHLDYARGAPCYADAYAILDEAPPAARYVILGTNHAGLGRGVVATGKDFLTPLGRVPTDRAFLADLNDRLGGRLCDHEADHLREHSIELQVHVLQVVQPDHPFEIVPVLCPDVCGDTGTAPADGHGVDVADFAAALADLLRASPRRTIVIAGADLSHVGQRFGEPAPTTPEFLERVAWQDRHLLSLLEARREDEFLATIRSTDNHTRICSAGCIYALLRALPDRACRILGYHQAVDYAEETHVTCAAATVT
jgi:AmmeMemoRadiSam system protein B